MLIILTAEIAAGVWAYQNSDKLEAFVKSNFKYTILNEYDVIDSRTGVVNEIQEHFQCCGADGPQDWTQSKFNNAKGNSIDLSLTKQVKFSVPKTCCKNGTEHSICETARKAAITSLASLNPVVNKEVSLPIISG